MTRYILRRILLAIPVLFGMATLLFVLMHLAPGDAATVLIRPGMTQETIDAIRARFGLDQPVYVQYVKWLLALASGNLGFSIKHGMDVSRVLLSALPHTLLLGFLSLVFAMVVGVISGVAQGVRPGSARDKMLGGSAFFFYSMPSFWLGIMLMMVFAYWLGLLPASGVETVGAGLTGWRYVLDRGRHLVLPTVTLGLVLSAEVSRQMRTAMIEAMGQPFVRTARAKGLPRHLVVFKHALRNALSPVLTLFGLYLPLLVGGAVLVEQVFAWPGMGRAVVDAIYARDYAVVLAGAMCFSVIVVVGNLMADVLYAIVDPRVRHG